MYVQLVEKIENQKKMNVFATFNWLLNLIFVRYKVNDLLKTLSWCFHLATIYLPLQSFAKIGWYNKGRFCYYYAGLESELISMTGCRSPSPNWINWMISQSLVYSKFMPRKGGQAKPLFRPAKAWFFSILQIENFIKIFGLWKCN